MQLKSIVWITIASLTFTVGMVVGAYLWERGKPTVAAPLVVDFCSLAENQDYLVGATIQTKAEMSFGIEGGVLLSDSCPAYVFVFKAPNNDACWQRISSDLRQGAGADFLVQVEGNIRGRRRSIIGFHESDKPNKDPAHRPPRVTVEIERILNCAKK